MSAGIEYFCSFSAPEAFGASEGFASHPPLSPLNKGGIKGGLTIGKGIRSNTLSPAIAPNFMNNFYE
jgi:hypothetical protein